MANIYPKLNPVYMENVEIHIPSKVSKLVSVFESPELKSLEHEILTPEPAKPDPEVVGEKIAEMSFDQRHSLVKGGQLKVSKNRIFLTGGQVRNYLLSHFHQITHTSKDWNLATDASPDAIPLIISFAKKYGMLPHDVHLKESNGKYWKFEIKYGSDSYSIFSFPFVDYKDAPRMYLQSLEHNFTANSLFYSPKESKIYDFHGGINDIRNKIARPIGDVSKLKEKGVYPLMLINLQAMMDSNVKVDGEMLGEINNFNLENSDRKMIHAEFVDGIKKAKDKENYIKKLDHYEMLQKLFPGLHVNSNIDIEKNTNFVVVLAEILKDNYRNVNLLQSLLTEMGYATTQVHSVVFLIKLPYYNDKNEFDHDKKLINISRKTVEDYIKDKRFANKKLLLYFMDETVAHKEPEEKLVAKHLPEPKNDFKKLSNMVNLPLDREQL